MRGSTLGFIIVMAVAATLWVVALIVVAGIVIIAVPTIGALFGVAYLWRYHRAGRPQVWRASAVGGALLVAVCVGGAAWGWPAAYKYAFDSRASVPDPSSSRYRTVALLRQELIERGLGVEYENRTAILSRCSPVSIKPAPGTRVEPGSTVTVVLDCWG